MIPVYITLALLVWLALCAGLLVILARLARERDRQDSIAARLPHPRPKDTP
ncbi:hypothetical protein BCL67_109101 [Nesterenkonia sandarakina]|uniref:Uncharacterized protein n=1 Tax=Nesterenkonia sandarakina TaxID=272918 RepID=A0A2T0YJ16_9MICC|nr:hypothetical protein BCL67_109101 [Nesterenkonia sandarakina]